MIELRSLRKEYPNVVVVDNVEVTIPEGEIYGLIGPNGAGKTTTIRMACGLLSPTSGSIRICKIDVHQHRSWHSATSAIFPISSPFMRT